MDFTEIGKQFSKHCFPFVDYCAAFCTPNVSQSSYLHTVGEKLLPGIDILWTGKIQSTVCLSPVILNIQYSTCLMNLNL